jgi:SAM-dependent methyltransferase
MDGFPNKKSKNWRGQLYSETRYAVIQWLERELPSVTGRVLNVASGNWPVPRQLLTNPGVTEYMTYDKKVYGISKNNVMMYGDVHKMPKDWTNKWDCVICNQAMECFENPFVAMEEIHRVMKKGGVLYIDSPYNVRWFGQGSWDDPEQNKKPVKDYWRITYNGWQILTKDFSNVMIDRSGPHKYDPYVYMIKCTK